MGARLKCVHGQVPVSGTANQYLNATDQGAAISMIQVTNTTAGNINVTLSVSNDNVTFTNIANTIIVPPQSAVGLLTGTLNIGAGGAIRLLAASGSLGNLTYAISMLEYSFN